MGKVIGNYILAALWIGGLILAGADGPVSPFLNLSGVAVIGIVSWVVYERQRLSHGHHESSSTQHEGNICSDKEHAVYVLKRGKVC